MRRFVLIGISLLTGVALAGWRQDESFGVPAAPKVGAKASYTIDSTIVIGGNEGTMKLKLSNEVKKADADGWEMESSWAGTEIMINGGPFYFPTDGKVQVTYDPAGQIKNVSTDLPMVEPIRLYAAITYLPSSQPLTKGKEVKETTKEIRMSSIPALQKTYLFQGKEKVGDVMLNKVEVKLEELDGDFKSDTTFWLNDNNVPQKFESNIKSMPLPSLGTTIDTVVKAQIIKE